MKKRAPFYSFVDFFKVQVGWRALWYSTLIWLLGFALASIVVLPWFYLAAPILMFTVTVFYFKIINPFSVKRGRRALADHDAIFTFGLGAAIAWFVIISVLTFAEIAGFYYFNFLFYFSDFRNWYLLVLILLVPVLYGLILENSKLAKRKKARSIERRLTGLTSLR